MSRVSKQYVEYLDSLAPPLFKKCHRITKQEFESLLQDVKNVAEIYDCTTHLMEMRLSVALQMFSGSRATELQDILFFVMKKKTPKISTRRILNMAVNVADFILYLGIEKKSKKSVACPNAPKKVVRSAQKFFSQFQKKMALLDRLIQWKEWDGACTLASELMGPAIEKLLQERDLPEKFRAQLQRELECATKFEGDLTTTIKAATKKTTTIKAATKETKQGGKKRKRSGE